MSQVLTEHGSPSIAAIHPPAVVDITAEREFAAFQQFLDELHRMVVPAPRESPALPAAAAPERPAAEGHDELLERWLISFGGKLSLNRISAFRQEFAQWAPVLEVRFGHVGPDAIGLRLVTDPSVRPNALVRMVLACRDRIGVPGQIAIRSI